MKLVEVGIPVELLQILKDHAVKVLHSVFQQIWKAQQWPQDWKRSVFFPISKKGNAKECSNYHTIAHIVHASKVMLKILHSRFHQDVNSELPDVSGGFQRGRGTRDQIVNILCIMEKTREFHDTKNVDNLISGSSASLKPSFYIENFSVHVQLKPSLKDLEHNCANMSSDCNCMVV